MLSVGLCEDDPAIRRIVSEAMALVGHRVRATHTGTEALRIFTGTETLDVIVLDIGLPDADGRDVAQALRTAGQSAPIIFLTALGALHDRLAGFSAGADDYLAKPFAVTELIARVEVVARRARQAAGPTPGLSGLALDPARHALTHGDREVLLSPTEFRMLAAISSRPGEVVRRRAVVAAAWPDGAIVAENTVDSFIRRLRRKLEAVESPARLETVRGVGFTLR